MRETANTLETGKWWTSWCRVAGMTTHRMGDSIDLAQLSLHSTTAHAEISISIPMASSLKAKLGWSVTDSKGWSSALGCVNWDGISHGMWLQEHMGWADQEIPRSYSYGN